jgi:hypothetical protein
MTKETDTPNYLRGPLATAALCAVFVIVAGFLGWTAGRQQEVRAAFTRSSLSDAAHQIAEVARDCSEGPASAHLECLSEALSNISVSWDELDLVAQQSIVNYEFWSLIIATFGLLLSAGGIIFIYNSLVEARKSSAIAMRGVEATWRTGQAQIRAYIGVNSVLVARATPETFDVFIEFENSGNSAARSLLARWWLRHRNINQPIMFNLGSGMGMFGDIRSAAVTSTNLSFTGDAEALMFIGSQTWIEVLLRFDYSDIMGERHQEDFVFSCPAGSIGATQTPLSLRPVFMGGNNFEA